MRLSRYSHAPFVERIWEFRDNLSAYVALSEALDAPIVTTDEPLARVPGHNARVEIYE